MDLDVTEENHADISILTHLVIAVTSSHIYNIFVSSAGKTTVKTVQLKKHIFTTFMKMKTLIN